MLFFKKITNFLIFLFLTFLFIIIFLEIYASINTKKFPSYGWQIDNKIEDKINSCKNKSLKVVTVFGDSHVEYHGENSSNLVYQLQKNFTNNYMCNLSLSGTDTTHYIDRFLYTLESDLQFNKAIFYLSESNDFADFRYKNIEDIKYNLKNKIDRELSIIMRFVKSYYALNIIYREGVKKYLLKNKIDEEFVKEIYSNKKYKYLEAPFDDALQRMINTPKKYKKLFSADILNINFYKLALRNPNYFKENFGQDKNFDKQKKIAFKHLDYINNVCQKNKIECTIMIVPNDQFLFAEAKKKYSEIFRFNIQKEYGKSKIVKELLKNYENIFYPDNVLEYKDYIIDDMHLTGSGNKKLAKFTNNLITNQ